MTKLEGIPKSEGPMVWHTRATFGILASDFIRHSSFHNRFMVPMHAEFGVRALYEPHRAAGNLPSGESVTNPADETSAAPWRPSLTRSRFIVPTALVPCCLRRKFLPDFPRRCFHDRFMRIIGGSAGKRLLKVPKGYDLRPTPDLVRQAVFNSLGARVVGARVLELFAGTGALGLECLSRAAASAVCVEKSNRHAEVLRHNFARLGLDAAQLEVRIQ